MTEQYRILLVEDDATIRNLTRMHLNMNGLEEVYSVVASWMGLHRTITCAVLTVRRIPATSSVV